MDPHEVDAALDLRTVNMASKISPYPSLLPSFNLCFSHSSLYGPSSELDALPTVHTPVVSPRLTMTRRVLQAAFSTRPGKPTRPFKAYPKNPLSLSMKTEVTEAFARSSNQAYLEFRQRMLMQLSAPTGLKTKKSSSLGTASVTLVSGREQEEGKDPAYLERRRKNNDAAKRSRDARRAKEDEIAIRAAFLEQENMKLKFKVATLRNELSRLRCFLLSRN